jgi:hypothetical protein
MLKKEDNRVLIVSISSRDMIALLDQHFGVVRQIGDITSLESLESDIDYEVIVMFDKSGAECADRLRRRFREAKMIYLCNNVSIEIEIALRSLGLVFLGYRTYFQLYCQEIFQSALFSFTKKRQTG